MSSKEDVRSAWVELVAASREYLKLPAEKPPAKNKPVAPITDQSKKVTGSSADVDRSNKRAKGLVTGEISRLLLATRTHPKYAERYVDQLGHLEEISSREQWEGEELHAIGMDCEMVQTVDDDMALARVSAVELSIDWKKGKIVKVMDELVMPTTSGDYIVDTRPVITGLNVEDLVEKGISKEEARRKFLSLLKPHTILVGHALEHDLLALGINHMRVVDTALLFLVEGNAAEYTHSLSHLSNAILEEATDRSKRQGTHDSVEDACLALKIVQRILCEPALFEKQFPITLPREESGAKRKLFGELGAKAQLLASRISVAEGNLKATMNSLRSKT